MRCNQQMMFSIGSSHTHTHTHTDETMPDEVTLVGDVTRISHCEEEQQQKKIKLKKKREVRTDGEYRVWQHDLDSSALRPLTLLAFFFFL
jgi:hypothetical protein